MYNDYTYIMIIYKYLYNDIYINDNTYIIINLYNDYAYIMIIYNDYTMIYTSIIIHIQLLT